MRLISLEMSLALVSFVLPFLASTLKGNGLSLGAYKKQQISVAKASFARNWLLNKYISIYIYIYIYINRFRSLMYVILPCCLF